MHRIDTPTAQKDKFGQGKNGFTRGNPQTGTLATKMDPLYFDAIQEEIANVIESVGIVLNKEKHDQLKFAIQQYVKNGQIKLNSSTNSDSQTEAATSLAVKKTYDLASLIIDTFRPTDGESVIFSPDKMYHTVVRNDGVLGFYNSKTDKVVWSISPDGGLSNGYVNADKIPGLNQFIAQTNSNISTITDKFNTNSIESRIYSHDKRFYLIVRDDGTVGMYNAINNSLMWGFDANGALGVGKIMTANIYDLEQFVYDRMPVGIPLPWPTITPPNGWAVCNGWRFDTSKNPRLAKAYPSGVLPDLRGEFIRGLDCGRGADPDRPILSWQPDAIRNFTGSFAFESNIGGNSGGAIIDGVFYAVPDSTRSHLASGTGGTNSIVKMDVSRGTPTSHDIHPRNLAFMYIVKLA